MRTLARFAALLTAVSVIYWFAIRPWHIRWGASDEEAEAAVPGDDLIPAPDLQATHAITINAPADAVWPWLVQMGQGKGGLYSYEWLENLAGCDMHNAKDIVPEWQNTRVGDFVRMGPEGYPLFKVIDMARNRALVLQAADPQTTQPASATWAFVLDEQPDGTTRLIVRSRNDYEPTVGNFLMWRLLVEPVAFIMEQEMLRGIKTRAETLYQQQRAA